MEAKICSKCGRQKELNLFYKNWVWWYRPKCKECENKPIKKYWIYECLYCKINFIKRNYQQKFCCENCRNKSKEQKYIRHPRIKSIKIKKLLKNNVCKFCFSEFKPYTTLDKFCSLECRNNFIKSKRKFNWTKEQCEKRKWKNNPAFRNWTRINQKPYKFSRLFKKNCKLINEKLINEKWYIFCEECWINNSLRFEHHHIIFRSEKPKHPELHNLSNIINLCIKCHNEFHKHKLLRNKYILERWLDKLFWQDIYLQTKQI
jgi:hypothetical protein